MAKYSLRDNPLTEDPNDKLAALEDVKSLTKEEIIDRILKRGNTMTKTDLLAAINAYEEECAIITEEGSAINTPLFNTSLVIQGKFDNGDPEGSKAGIFALASALRMKGVQVGLIASGT